MFTVEIDKEDIQNIRRFVNSENLVGAMNEFGLNAASMLAVLQTLEDFCDNVEKELNND